MLTLPREKMASRVGASLVLSLNIPELVARTMAEYVDLAVLLGRSPVKAMSLRKKWALSPVQS